MWILLKASTHCALCRTRPEPDHDPGNLAQEHEAWEYKILACKFLLVVCCSSDYWFRLVYKPCPKYPHAIIAKADLREPKSFSLESKSAELSIKFCFEPECRECEGGGIAHLIHRPCWNLLNQSTPSALSIYEVAQSLYPLFSVGDVIGEPRSLMDLMDTDIQDLDVVNPANALKLFLQLPTEIRSAIATDSRRSLMSSLLTVKKTLRLSTMMCCLDRTIAKCNGVKGSLWVQKTSILTSNTYQQSHLITLKGRRYVWQGSGDLGLQLGAMDLVQLVFSMITVPHLHGLEIRQMAGQV
jgi:hypothetical protein